MPKYRLSHLLIFCLSLLFISLLPTVLTQIGQSNRFNSEINPGQDAGTLFTGTGVNSIYGGNL